jgi:hypothetical protein
VARYRLYGLVVESPISLPSAPATRAHADVVLQPADPRTLARTRRLAGISAQPRHWFECGRLADGAAFLRWSDLFEFLITDEGRTIHYHRLKKATDESLAVYLLGQVLSFPLLSRGVEPLHATAVVIDGAAAAFLGDCGYGKSTLGAAFVARGFPMLTDDVLAVEQRRGTWIAHPGPSRLKLFPLVARRVLDHADGERMNAGTAKLIVPLDAGETINGAVPLAALYVLPVPRRARRTRTARAPIADVTGQEAFLEITKAAFNLIRVDRERLANQFSIATALARDVPVRRLTHPRRLAALPVVCERVIADVKALNRRRQQIGTAG